MPSRTAARERLDPLVLDGKIRGYLWVGPRAELDNGEGKWQKDEPVFVYSEKRSNRSSAGAVRQMVQLFVLARRAAGLGIDSIELRELLAPPPLRIRALSPKSGGPDGSGEGVGGAPDRASAAVSQILTYLLLFALYMAIVLYGNSISMSVVNEKSGRVAEVLVAAARPHEIMFGKLVGVGLAGLVQFGVWVAAGALTLGLAPVARSFLPENFVAQVIRAVPVPTLLYLTLFFILGFFI